MILYISVKQAGKRKDYITKRKLVLDDNLSNLSELITHIIQMEVNEYNNKVNEALIIKYLSNEALENQANTGKVGFGERRSDNQADARKAIDTAILAFEDGIYRVFINESEVSSLNEPLSIKEGDTLTFIRLTMLAGRMW